MKKNTLVVNGSPHGKKGVTYMLQRQFVRGAENAGAEVDEVFLNKKKISPCLGCFTCWIQTPGNCVIRDDQAELLEKLLWADIFVLATPVYVDGITGQSKVFLDRTVPLLKPEITFREDHCRHPSRRNKASKFAVISNCGFHEVDNFDSLVMHCRKFCLNMNAEYAGHLLRPHGPVLRYPEMMAGEIKKVLEAAEKAGEELVRQGRISHASMEAVSAEIVPKRAYVEAANFFWRQELEKIGQ
ncbi:MAG: flavodoxin family protein [Desulfomonile tiedjei]|uniref:Flavodoxin family protein n=1 Tax=Desulfomonile tiedjei TaxID=2358 RepID=A0A9D6V0M0_9BACT|nr:flavodoxin family protein [Desulfomonile tiedjei]